MPICSKPVHDVSEGVLPDPCATIYAFAEGIRQLINDKPEYLPHAEVVIGGTVFVVIMKFGM